jgi:ABC-type multidrug transport system ATPase subunit
MEQTQDGHRLLDLGSTNHVYINGQRITHQLLKAGDEIRIGPFKFIYTGTQLTQYDESSSIRIDAHHLKRIGNRGAVLINDISLAIPPRKFVAIVGGSGAGKSTLMNALNGQQPAQEGTVYYNGQDYYRSLAAFNTQLGIVPQDDIMHRDLSVERALYYAAKLRLPEDFTEAQINQRINEVLDDVEMKHRRKLLVSKLSGGQRKRISIALELLANPSVFFLDEPTSGLDPGLDRKMMFLLRKLADKGHTIVLVTHATSNINACDFICFLAQGGRLAFFGPPNEAKTYFDTDDFAEIYSSLEPTEDNPNIPAEAETRFKASPLYQKYIVEALAQGTQRGVTSLVGARPAGLGSSAHKQQPMRASTSVKRGNPWRQFLLLSMRYIELIKNDVGYLLILLLQAPLIGLILLLIVKFLLGSATFNWTTVAVCPTRANVASTSGPVVSNDCQRVVDFLNSPAGTAFAAQQGKSKDQLLQDAILPGSGADAHEVLFIMAFAAVMFGCTNAAREVVKEIPIYRREHAVNLGIAPYLLSKMAVLGVLCLLQSAVLVVMVNFAAPLRQGIILPANLEVYITLALTSLAGLMLGLMLSAVAPNTDRALSFLPLLLIPQVIFSGVIFSLNLPVMQILGAFFPARWAMAGLGSSVGLHGDKLGTDSFSYQGTLFASVDPAKAQGTALAHLLLVWSALTMMIVLFGLLTGYFLKRKEVRA